MIKRSLTVGYSPASDYRDKVKPYIRFGGKWLNELGISVGDRIELIQKKNELVIKKIPQAS